MWMLRKLQAVVLQYSSLNDWIRLLLTSECCGLPRGECGNGFNYKQKLGSILSPRHEARILRSKSLPHHDIWKHHPHWKVIQVCMCGDLNMNTCVQLYSCIYLCVSYERTMQISTTLSTLETHAQPGDDCSLLIYCQYNVIRINLMVSLFISYSCSLTGSDCPSVRIRTERKEANIW